MTGDVLNIKICNHLKLHSDLDGKYNKNIPTEKLGERELSPFLFCWCSVWRVWRRMVGSYRWVAI